MDIKCFVVSLVFGQCLQYGLVVQFVAESRFANCEFANLFFDFDELQFS